MATYYSGYSNGYRLRLVITQGTQSVANNTSAVSWTLSLLSGNKNMSVYSTYHATVDGVTAPSTTQTNVTIGYNTSVTLGSGSTTVTHNSDGTRSVPFSASFKTNTAVYNGGVLVTPGTMTISGNFALTTIPRYAAITAFTASVNDRTASLSWTADKTISEWRWSINSGSNYYPWQTVNAKSGSGSVSISPGSTYGFRIQVRNPESGLVTTSSVVSRTATKTPSTLTLNPSSQNVGSNITWTINESYDYTHKITYYFGDRRGYVMGTDAAASGASTGTWTVPTNFANQIPNATSGTGSMYLTTFYGDVIVGQKSYTFTAKVPNNTTWQPSVPTVTITDAVTQPTGITSYVQGKSRAKVVSSSAAQGGASISNYRVRISDIGTYFGSTITSRSLYKSGTVTITVRATDSRGYYREKVSTIAVVPYSPPKMTTYTANRSPNEQGTDLAAHLNFSISPIDNQNTTLYRIRYRPTGGVWITTAERTDYYARNTGPLREDVLDINTSYEVEFHIADSYTSVTQVRTIGTAFQLLDFNASGRGVAFGKVSEKDAFEVGMPAEFPGGIEPIRVPAGSNINDYQTPGFYYNPVNAQVAEMTNTADSNAFSLIVYRDAGVTQVWNNYATNNHLSYMRSYYNSTWSDWKSYSMDGHTHTENTFHGVLLYSTYDQSIPSGTSVPVTWYNFEYKTINSFWMVNTGREKIFIPKGVKKVRVSANTYWAVSSTGYRDVTIKKNGGLYRGIPQSRHSASGALRAEQNITSAVVDVNEGDYFELYVGQTTGSPLDLVASSLLWFALEVIEYDGD